MLSGALTFSKLSSCLALEKVDVISTADGLEDRKFEATAHSPHVGFTDFGIT